MPKNVGLIMMPYKVIKTDNFVNNFKKLDNSIKINILKYIKKLELSDNPKAYGKELSGNMAGLYRFRINNYRLITKIEEEKLIIYALGLGHRSKIYEIQNYSQK